MSQLGRFFGLIAMAASPLAACSVINSFDDVVPQSSAGGEGGTSSAGRGGANSAGRNTGGDIADAGTGGYIAPPIKGLLAVAGTDPTKVNVNVVSLIDPTTGTELARQTVTGAVVTGLAYDGADGKDVWFEFTGTSFPAAATSKAAMNVFTFEDDTNTWRTYSTKTLPALPPPRPETFVVLNDRLSYLSYTIVGGKAVDSLTVLDTTDPSAVTQVKFTALDFGVDTEVLGMVGTRGVPGDPTALGGTLAIVVGTGCMGGKAMRGCSDVDLLPVTVGEGENVTQGTVAKLAPTPVTLVGQPAFSSAQAGQLGYVAFTTAVGKSVTLKRFDPRDPTSVETGSPAFKSAWLGGLTYAECQNVALFTGVAQGKLFAASPAGLTGELDLGYPGQSVVYEPFTQRAITLFNPDNTVFADSGFDAGEGGAGGASGEPKPALNSFNVTKNAALAVTDTASWNPPSNLAPNLAVARFPVSYVCK